MKKTALLLFTILLFAQTGNSQNTSLSWRLGTPNMTIYDKLNVFTATNQLNAMNATFGTGVDLNVNYKKFLFQGGLNLGYNTATKGQILTSLKSFSGDLLFGREIPIVGKSSISLLLGYSCQSLRVDGYDKMERNFSTLTVSNSTGMLQLQNLAHCIAFKLETNFMEDQYILAVGYNHSLTNNPWAPENGTLMNAPKDNLSNWTISFKYSIFRNKW
jgi:hypothetical protein